MLHTIKRGVYQMKKMLIVFVLLTIILSGCFSNTGTEPVTLKVVYDSQEEFMNKYGDMYRVKHPNILNLK